MKKCKMFVVVLFYSISYANAASFVPVQEMTYCNSDAYIKVSDTEDYSDRHDEWHPYDNRAESNNELTYSDGNILALSYSNFMVYVDTSGESTYTNDSIHLNSDSFSAVEKNTESAEHAYAWTGAEMVDPGTAVGNYYQITAEEDESTGDWVDINIYLYAIVFASCEGGSSYTAMVHGPNEGDILFTRNCADFSDPQPGEIVCSFDAIEADYESMEQGSFSAQIGDIIGIHCGTFSNAYTTSYMGMANSSAEVYIDMTMTKGSAEFTAAMADFDGSGIVDLLDFAMFASVWLQSTETN